MNKLKIGFVAFFIIGVVFIATVIGIQQKPSIINPALAPIACTEEAKLCPDGSYVGRTGPQCQFSPCPKAVNATTTTSTGKTSGITGSVLLGPRCPVMRNPPDPQCADKPYSANLEVTTQDGTKVVAQFNSDTQGNFKINVPPGGYMVRSAMTNLYPRCISNGPVVVKTGEFTNVSVSCDTGIR